MTHPTTGARGSAGTSADGSTDPATGVCEVVITAADADWLAAFTRYLVTERLAACGQLTLPVRSIYRWDGDIQDEVESRVPLHTSARLVPRIIEEANALNPLGAPSPSNCRRRCMGDKWIQGLRSEAAVPAVLAAVAPVIAAVVASIVAPADPVGHDGGGGNGGGGAAHRPQDTPAADSSCTQHLRLPFHR